MSSIDKLALTCRLLYDERVLEQRKEIEKQRKEIEKLKLKFFFRDYTPAIMRNAMKNMNLWNLRCKCRDCKKTGRIGDGVRVDREAACTFVPWLDYVLHERGLVVLRNDVHVHFISYSDGPYDNFDDDFDIPDFTFDDCHLVEHTNNDEDEEILVRWAEISIGKRLWNASSFNNQWITAFGTVFGGTDGIFIDRNAPGFVPLA
jgi:hypothetical protein